MSRVILALLVLVAVASALPRNLLTPIDCDVNEEFVRCGTACEPSCGVSESNSCILKCVVGCQCKQGFLRNSANTCVRPFEC